MKVMLLLMLLYYEGLLCQTPWVLFPHQSWCGEAPARRSQSPWNRALRCLHHALHEEVLLIAGAPCSRGDALTAGLPFMAPSSHPSRTRKANPTVIAPQSQATEVVIHVYDLLPVKRPRLPAVATSTHPVSRLGSSHLHYGSLEARCCTLGWSSMTVNTRTAATTERA